jgi:hypothetical protein
VKAWEFREIRKTKVKRNFAIFFFCFIKVSLC